MMIGDSPVHRVLSVTYRRIQRLYHNGESVYDLAARYEVSIETVERIVDGQDKKSNPLSEEVLAAIQSRMRVRAHMIARVAAFKLKTGKPPAEIKCKNLIEVLAHE